MEREALSPSQNGSREVLAEVAAGLFERCCPRSRLGGLGLDEPFDPAVWAALAAASVPALPVPETVGGQGGGLAEAVVVLEEAGRVLAPVPLAETMAAARLLARAVPGHPLLGQLVGTKPPPVACAVVHGTVTSQRDGTVNGRLRSVRAAPEAAAVVAIAHDRHGPAAPVLIATPRDGVRIEPHEVLAGPGAADVVLEQAAADVLAGGAAGPAACADLLDDLRILHAAELIGIAAAGLDATVAHVGTRRQFGRAIGSFQAVQHRLADVAIAVDGARMAVRKAATRRDAGAGAALPAAAFVLASDAAAEATSEGVQFFGGYGYALDSEIQAYLRAAKVTSLAAGRRHTHLALVADAALGSVSPPMVNGAVLASARRHGGAE